MKTIAETQPMACFLSDTAGWTETIYTSCLLRSRRPFISNWTSKTASIVLLRGVSGVLRTGVAVFTSTSHKVSACAGNGVCVLGST